MNAAANVIDGQDQNYWILLHIFQMESLISELLCPVSNEPGLSLLLCQGENAGFTLMMKLKCAESNYETIRMSSLSIGFSDSSKVPYEANRHFV